MSLAVLVALVCACRHAPKDTFAQPKQASDASVARGVADAADSAVAEAPARDAGPAAGEDRASSCNEQPAQEFLVNAHFNGRPLVGAEALREWKGAVAQSIRYRTEQYGYYAGFGSYTWNPKPLHLQMRTIKFFGLSVRLHERVIPALGCVEEALRRECAASPYQPKALSGLRERNTYLDGDASNHVYGIAIDIDPLRNPCCNCIEPWRSSPRCQGNKTDLERMDMPACWIGVFERFGFYWLGHDALKDTMHFEFLGDPARIMKSDAG